MSRHSPAKWTVSCLCVSPLPFLYSTATVHNCQYDQKLAHPYPQSDCKDSCVDWSTFTQILRWQCRRSRTNTTVTWFFYGEFSSCLKKADQMELICSAIIFRSKPTQRKNNIHQQRRFKKKSLVNTKVLHWHVCTNVWISKSFFAWISNPFLAWI